MGNNNIGLINKIARKSEIKITRNECVAVERAVTPGGNG